MSGEDLNAHLKTGTTTVCRVWSVVRQDGTAYGFTDHDLDIEFEGLTYKAGSGMTARALQQTSGLSVDNTEALGALSDLALKEEDILAGRFDNAEVKAWLVNWANPLQRKLLFRGSFGEVVRSGGAFRVDLRGLSEALNQPKGRVFHRACSAVLGDTACRKDLTQAGYSAEAPLETVVNRARVTFAGLSQFEDGWFESGRFVVLTGTAAGLVGHVKSDRKTAMGREIYLWQNIGTTLAAGDVVRIEAGCDKLSSTCKNKFVNFDNFRGFPHIPGDDWLSAYPASDKLSNGGSLFRSGGD